MLRIGLLLAATLPGTPPAAHASPVVLAPSWGMCGANLGASEWPNPQSPNAARDSTCNGETGAAEIRAHSDTTEIRLGRSHTRAYFYAGDMLPEGIRHRRYVLTMQVDEAWVRGAAGPAGSSISVGIAAHAVDCEQDCFATSAGATIVGGGLAPASISNTDVTIVLDLAPDGTQSRTTLPSGNYSFLVWIDGGTQVVNTGPWSLAASVSSSRLTAETIA